MPVLPVVAHAEVQAGARPVAVHAAPRMAHLSPRGPAFLTYDGGHGTASSTRDWPVSLIFTGHASIARVKAALRKLGFTRAGHTAYLPYRLGSAPLRFDHDKGVKTPCNAGGKDLHVRLYAPAATGNTFVDPRYGHVVIATTHIDSGDGCGGSHPAQFGFSELAEGRIAQGIASRLHWQVRRNALSLGNGEPFRRDVFNPDHVWMNDGRATLVAVPNRTLTPGQPRATPLRARSPV
jgi:hypothetical protein